MAALDAAVVLLAAQGVATEGAIEGGEEALGKGGDVIGIVTAELNPPVGLELHEAREAVATDPEQAEDGESEAVVLGKVVAVGEETEAGAGLAGGPLEAGEVRGDQMVAETGAQGALVVNILGVHLHQREREIGVPSPRGRIEGLALLAGLAGDAVALQDVADGASRDRAALLL